MYDDVYLRKGDSSSDPVTLDYSYSHVNVVCLKFEFLAAKT